MTDWPTTYNRKSRTRQSPARTHREKSQTQPFVAWDGEGYSTNDGRHHYMLFGSSCGAYVYAPELSFRDCFPLLLESSDNINVIYGGDYDIIMMTKGMPRRILRRLLTGQPVKYAGYRMVWYRRKQFMLRDLQSNQSVVLYDVLSFFQCSFVKACREYLGNDDIIDRIAEMKARRDAFTWDDPTVIQYWQSELDYLVRLMTVLRELLQAVDIYPRKWYGPGAIAHAVLQSHEMKQYYHPFPAEVIDVAERAYYGGRFEQFQVGRIPNVFEYDIRSAYPAAMTSLPEFGKQWMHVEIPANKYPRLDPMYLYCISWELDDPVLSIGPFPWRSSDGRIYYPPKGTRSWYWGIELIAGLRHMRRHEYTIHEMYVPRLSGRQPFDWVQTMYDARAEMKRTGNPAQKALKLALNSIYGKLAQSRTGATFHVNTKTWTKPAWHHILWAGWITAHTRAQLLDALQGNFLNLVALETDALFTRCRLPVSLGEGLGEWEETTLDQILYIHSGVYYARQAESWTLKSRGVEAQYSKAAAQWLELFADLPHIPKIVTASLRRFGTDLRSPRHYARWYELVRTTTLPVYKSKRMHHPELCATCILGADSYAETPHRLVVPQQMIDSDWLSSTPPRFPWRTDIAYDWGFDLANEEIITGGSLSWS